MPKKRRSLEPKERDEFVEKVIKQYDDDLADRSDWSQARLQRYAKLRGWLEPKTYPWPDACFTLDTDILTVDGWKPIGDVKEGEEVYTMDENGVASYAPVTATIHEWAHKLVSFKGKSIDLLVTPNHRMLVHRNGRYTVAPAESFLGKQNSGHIPLTSTWDGVSSEFAYGIDKKAYVRFLGWYISEGHACYISKPGCVERRPGSFFISQSAEANPEKCLILEKDLNAIGATWKKYDRGYTVHASSLPYELREELRRLGTAEEKYIPDHVLWLSRELLVELLDTLVLGDGTVNKRNGHSYYYTVSKTLADDVQVLAQRIGKRATIVEREQVLGGKIRGRQITSTRPIYHVSINDKEWIKVQSLKRDLIETSCPVACVEVPPHHSIYVRRNGKAVWCGNSNQHVPMLMSNSLRTQDTLHNAVLGTRPVMSAIAVNKADAEKGTHIDELHDFQLFVEQNGEEKIGDLICNFVDDGKFVAFLPWITDARETVETKAVPSAPDGSPLNALYEAQIKQWFPEGVAQPAGEDKYRVTWIDDRYKKHQAEVEFYCDDDNRYFALVTQTRVVFDGPCLIPKNLEDIIVPSRAGNLQPPSPSNPNGADHVCMIDYPSWDEVHRLYKRGYYDLLDADDHETIESYTKRGAGATEGQRANSPEEHKVQRDALAGMQYGNAETVSKTLTRLTYFGRFDLDGDGFEEEIVARILLEPKKLCRVRLLQEEFPTPTPRRPFAEGTFIPVPDQFYGIGLLELLEHLHDLTKVLLDQMIDKHTLSNVPWGLYRSASGVRPENIRMAPGTLYPVSNPQQDIAFPSLPQQDQAMALNLIALVQQWAEKQSMQGMLQFGGVPQGKASALRTSTNMMSVLQQGDARPERILRRFFRGLAEIYQQMHELNQAFLQPNKQYRVMGVVQPGEDPYRSIQSPSQISGQFQFDFRANALNTNKAVTSQILSELMPMVVNGLTLQMGITNPEKIYNLIRDAIQSRGQDYNKYIVAPPEANIPKITAEDAMGQMVQGVLPQGKPAEGAQVHLQTLQRFAQQDPRYYELLQSEPAFQMIFQTYVRQVQQQMAQEQAMAMMAQQFAGAFGGGGGQPGPEGAVQPGADEMAMQGMGQVNDESLPGAKGMM